MHASFDARRDGIDTCSFETTGSNENRKRSGHKSRGFPCTVTSRDTGPPRVVLHCLAVHGPFSPHASSRSLEGRRRSDSRPLPPKPMLMAFRRARTCLCRVDVIDLFAMAAAPTICISIRASTSHAPPTAMRPVACRGTTPTPCARRSTWALMLPSRPGARAASRPSRAHARRQSCS